MIDFYTCELLGWHPSRSGKATTFASALGHALTSRFGTLGRVTQEVFLRSDSGLVFTSRRYTALVHSYGLTQELITQHCPHQKGMTAAPAQKNHTIKHLEPANAGTQRTISLSSIPCQTVPGPSQIRPYDTYFG